MKRKLKILRLMTSLNPKFGGPNITVISSSLVLSKQGFKVDILTCDPKNSNFFKSKKIRIMNKGPSILGEFGFSLKYTLWLLKHRHEYDAFIIHGIWMYTSLIARILLKKKYFVFTHGQLDPFFGLNLIKKIKKQIYWHLIEKKNLLLSRSLILTSEGEKTLLNNTYVNTNGIRKTIVRYGINQPRFNKTKALRCFYKKFPNLKNKRFLLFLGRFHEKKGCDILIKAIKKLSDQNININVLLAGPNNKYKKKIMNLSDNYGLKDNIFWSDIILNNLKWGAISASIGMALPSHSENFGVALVESLSCSKPVLTTNKVNIYLEILKFKSGYISRNETNDYVKILKKFSKLKKNQLLKFNKNAKKCFKSNFDLSLKENSLATYLKHEVNKKNE